ncbi:MAG: ATP-binding protein [Desulfuromonadaceae bacterium]|nr:ATP-binding protein [Desulfuromonadaceae bacterium]
MNELTLLYQFSNTMLSTIRLNKLTHLILTALTTSSSNLFERAFLFLRNEKSEVLQGMLGVTRRTAEGLQIVGSQEALGSRWEISEDVISLQRSTEFCAKVRATRIDINDSCPLIRRVIADRTLCHTNFTICHECGTCFFVRHLCSDTFAAVPLVARDSAIGIIVVDNPESGQEITQENLRFLQLFANQAGMAVLNSMLYNRIEDAHINLRDARERLLHGERLAAIGEVAANLAHELKNPIITIGGFAARLLKGLSEESKEHQYAGTIVKEVGRLEKMLADILAFSSKPTICFSVCDLGEILRDCLESCATTVEDHGIRLNVDNSRGSWSILGDAHQLKQVFLNLILNACDAMSDGGRLTISVSSASPENNSVIVSIEDTGGGIAQEMLSKIFNPFFTTKSTGTGLGLAIVNRIVLNHFGTIRADNTELGALFSVMLPLVEAEQIQN